MTSPFSAPESRMLKLGYRNESSAATEEALRLAQIQLKVRVTRIIRRCVNWKKGMVFDAWNCNVNDRIRLRRTAKNVLVRWNNRLLVGSFEGWKAGTLEREKPRFTVMRRKSRALSIADIGVDLQLKTSPSLKSRPRSYTGSLPVLWPNQGMAFQDLRTEIVSPSAGGKSTGSKSPNKNLSSTGFSPQQGHKFSFASYVAADTAKDLHDVKKGSSAELLETFRRLWNDIKIFSEFCDASLPEEGSQGHYCLRSLGQRSSTMDFKELLCLLSSESLLAERGSVYDPLKLSVSTIHSVFRVVNLKCYTAWWSTRKAKKEIEALEGAADKFELGFKEYQMVMLTLGCELGLSVTEITKGSSRFYDPRQIDRILALSRYDSNRLAHTPGAPLHVARSRFREPEESGIDLLASAMSASKRGHYDRANAMAMRASQVFLLSNRPDLLCEVQIVQSRISAMERISRLRETKMQNEVCRLLLDAEARARALEIENSRHLLKEAGNLAEKGNFPKRGALQDKFDKAVKALDEAELVIKGDEKLNQGWECVQRDELNEAEKYLAEAQSAYASTDLRSIELKNCKDALEKKRSDEQRIRLQGKSFMNLAREAIREEHFSEAARLIDEARNALTMWTTPAGQNGIIVTKLTDMIAKTWSNKFLFEAFCAFDDKNLSGQGSRALMMDFNEFLHLLQDLGVLEVKAKRTPDFSKPKNAPKRRKSLKPIDLEKLEDSKFKGREFQMELCRQCSFPEIHENPLCKLAKADVYEIFRAVNLRSVAQLHRGNTDADSDMSSLDFTEYQLCMLRIGKLLGLPLTDNGGSPLFLKDLRDLEDLKAHFIDVKRDVRERLLMTGEKASLQAKKSMQECNFAGAREHLEYAVSQYQRIDDEKIQRHYLSNCKRIAESIDREEKREVVRKSEHVGLAEAALAKIKNLLDEYDELGCRFDEQKFKICETEAENAWRFFKNAQSYGTQQKDMIQELKTRIQASEQRIAMQRQALWQGKEELHLALEIMETCASFMHPNDVVHVPHNREIFVLKIQDSHEALSHFGGNAHESRLLEHCGVINASKFQDILLHLKKAKNSFVLSKDYAAQRSYEEMLRQFVSFAKNWVSTYSVIGYAHMEDARKKLHFALSEHHSEVHSSLDYFTEAEKSLHFSESFMKKAMEVNCVAPYLEDSRDLFGIHAVECFGLELNARKEAWNKRRAQETTEAANLATSCSDLILKNDLHSAEENLARAKLLWKGENQALINKLEIQIHQKKIEDEAKTKVMISKARNLMKSVDASMAASMFEITLKQIDEALSFINQIHSVNLKPDVKDFKEELVMFREQAFIKAVEVFESASSIWLTNCDRIMHLLYSTDFPEAKSVVAGIQAELSSLANQGILRIIREDEGKCAGLDDVHNRIDIACAILDREEEILKSIKDSETTLGNAMLARIVNHFQETGKDSTRLDGSELEFITQLFAGCQVLCHDSQEDQFLQISMWLKHCRENSDRRRKDEKELAWSLFMKASHAFSSGQNMQAQHLLESARHLVRQSHEESFEKSSNLLMQEIVSSCSNILEQEYIELCDKIDEGRQLLLKKKFDQASLIFMSVRRKIEHEELQDSIFSVMQSSDSRHHGMAELFPAILSKALSFISQAEQDAISWHLHMRELKKSFDKHLKAARVALNRLDFLSTKKSMKDAQELLSNEIEEETILQREQLSALNEELIALEQQWNDEENVLGQVDPVTGYNALFSACADGNVERLGRLLRHRPDLKCVDRNGWTVLHHAAANGRSSCLQALLSYDVDIDAQDARGTTAMVLGIHKGCLQTVKILLDRGASTKLRDSEEKIAIHHCALQNRSECIEEILWRKRWSNFEVESDSSAIDYQLECHDGNGWTPLMLAVMEGSIDAANSLLSNGGNPRATDRSGLNSLHLAAKFDIHPLIPILAAFVKDVDCPCGLTGASPLMIASANGRIGALQTLLECNADPNFQDRQLSTALHVACSQTVDEQRVHVVKLLLDAGSNHSIKDSHGLTALQLACIHGHTNIVQCLASREGFSLAVSDQIDYLNENTVFLCVLKAQRGCLMVLKDVEGSRQSALSTFLGWNSFHLAVLMGDTQAVTILLEEYDSSLVNVPLQDIGSSPLCDLFFQGDTPILVANKCLRLARIFQQEETPYIEIIGILNSYITVGGAETTQSIGDVETAAGREPEIQSAASFPLQDVVSMFELHKKCAPATKQLRVDKDRFLELIQKAERHELENVRSASEAFRKTLHRAEGLSKAGDAVSAFEALTVIQNLLEGSYDHKLYLACKGDLEINIAQYQLDSLEKDIRESKIIHVYDMTSGSLNMDVIGSQLSTKIHGDREWQRIAMDRVITAEVAVSLETILLKACDNFVGVPIFQEVFDSCASQIRYVELALRDANEDTKFFESIDCTEKLNKIKDGLSNIRGLVNNMEFFDTEETNCCAQISSFGSRHVDLSKELYKAEERLALQRLFEKCGKAVQDLPCMFSVSYASFLLEKVQSKIASLPDGNETLLNCIEAYADAIQNAKTKLTHDEIHSSLDSMISAVGIKARKDQVREAQEEIRLVKETCLENLKSAEYSKCTLNVKDIFKCLEAYIPEQQSSCLRWAVVHEFHASIMRQLQQDAESKLNSGEDLLFLILTKLNDSNDHSIPVGTFTGIESVETMLKAAGESFQRVHDSRTVIKDRILRLGDSLKRIQTELEYRQVRQTVQCLIEDVECLESNDEARKALEALITLARAQHGQGCYTACIKTLDRAKDFRLQPLSNISTDTYWLSVADQLRAECTFELERKASAEKAEQVLHAAVQLTDRGALQEAVDFLVLHLPATLVHGAHPVLRKKLEGFVRNTTETMYILWAREACEMAETELEQEASAIEEEIATIFLQIFENRLEVILCETSHEEKWISCRNMLARLLEVSQHSRCDGRLFYAISKTLASAQYAEGFCAANAALSSIEAEISTCLGTNQLRKVEGLIDEAQIKVTNLETQCKPGNIIIPAFLERLQIDSLIISLRNIQSDLGAASLRVARQVELFHDQYQRAETLFAESRHADCLLLLENCERLGTAFGWNAEVSDLKRVTDLKEHAMECVSANINELRNKEALSLLNDFIDHGQFERARDLLGKLDPKGQEDPSSA